MKPRTAAEQQIEMLRQMKEAKTKRKPPPPAAPPPARPQGPGFELDEGPRQPKPKAKGPGLPLTKETWRRLRERQTATREFRTRRDMGEWAAALLLALPPGAYQLGDEAKTELLRKLAEWAEARGLRP